MANTKVTGALIADATITATNIADGAVTAAKLTGITTTSIAEGDKLFYTDARVGTYLSTNGYDTAANIIATITDSAPVTLDTLNELAAALGDDPNYATTTANLIGTKLPLAGGTLTGGLHINTNSLPQLLIQNVDGGTNAEKIAIELNAGDIFKIRSLNDNNTTRVDNIITANILTGNVGVQLPSSDSKLQIANANGSSYRFGYSGTSDVYIDARTTYFRTSDGNSNNFIIDADGNVLIGTTTKRANYGRELIVDGTNVPNEPEGFLVIRGQRTSGNIGGLAFYNGNEQVGVIISQSQGNLRFLTGTTTANTSEAMRIDSDGNFGFGTLGGNPAAPMHFYKDSVDVNGNNDVTLLLQNTLYNSTQSGDTFENKIALGWANHYAAGISAYKNTVNTTGLKFYTEYGYNVPEERMRITAVGNIGIGTTSPTARLDVNSGATNVVAALRSTDEGAYIAFADNTTSLDAGYPTSSVGVKGDNLVFSTNNSEKVRINSTGDLSVANGQQATNAAGAEILLGNRGYFSSPYIGAAKIVSVTGSPNWYSGTGLAFYTNPGPDVTARGPEERLRILPSGGITFNGDTAAANALDDYEEGTWTPTISHNDGTGVIPLTVNSAKYVKIGSLVYLSCYLTNINPAGNAGTSSPYYGIRGFPFPPDTYGAWQIVYASSTVSSYGGYSAPESFYFMNNGSNGQRSSVHLSGSDVNSWGAGINLMMNAVYRIA